MTMTLPSDTNTSTVLDLTTALRERAGEHTPAGITELLTPECSRASWLLVGSNALAENDQAVALRMLLERAASLKVAIALDVRWQPQNWGLAPGSPPTSEVLRRFRTLAEASALIRTTDQEAEWFFQYTDPVRIHLTLPQRPAVLISDQQGPVRWCLGGHSGHLPATADSDAFLAVLLDGLCRHPQLLGSGGPGLDAVADPEGLADLLRSAAGERGTG